MRTDTGCFPDKAQGIHSGLGNNSQVIRHLGIKLEISGHNQSLSPTTGLCTSTRETQRRLQGQYLQVSGPHPHRQSYLINTHTYSYVKVCSRTMQTHTHTRNSMCVYMCVCVCVYKQYVYIHIYNAQKHIHVHIYIWITVYIICRNTVMSICGSPHQSKFLTISRTRKTSEFCNGIFSREMYIQKCLYITIYLGLG